jgi:hypothetical protein
MKKSPAAVALLGHDIRVRSWSFGSSTEESNVNFVGAAIVKDQISQRVLADEACGKQGKGRSGFGEVYQDIVRGAACPLRLAADVAELLRLRVNINHFYLIDDPVASGQNAMASVCGLVFHGWQRRGVRG